MSKIQCVLSFICLFMLEASIIEANDAPLINDINKTVVKYNNQEICSKSLLSRSMKLTTEMSDDLSRIRRPLYGQRQRENVNSSPNFSGDLLLDRIRLIENEQDMIQQGYTANYVAGLDHAKASLQLAYLLRQRFSDPTITTDPERVHVSEFARFVNPHIDFVERGIRNSDSSDKNLRLSQLEQLRSEARFVQERKELTYRYLLDLTLRLSILASSQEELLQSPNGSFLLHELQVTADTNYDDITRIARRTLNRVLDRFQFPKFIVVPTIENSGNLGIISNNRVYGTGVHPIGLTDKPTDAHNTTMPPLFFLGHDMLHAVLLNDVDMSQFVNLFLYKSQSLSKLPRERVELVFYELTHEHGHDLSTMTSIQEVQDVVEKHMSVSVYDYGNSGFLPFIPGHNHIYGDVVVFLQKTRLDFVRLFTETRAEFNLSEEAVNSL